MGPLRTCTQAILSGTAAAAGLFAYVKWWRKGFTSEWATRNEGWFGRDTYSGGVDKFAHAFSLYVGTRLLTRALDWGGNPHADSIRTSGAAALGAALAVEVFDGLSKRAYGFSKEDFISGALGVGLGVLMEARPELDDYFALRLMYRAPFRVNHLVQPFDDYEHQVYLAVLRLSGFKRLGRTNPLRFVEVVAGYGATGFDSGSPRRRLYVGIGIDVTEILKALLFSRGGTGGVSMGEAFATESLRYVQPPGTALTTRFNL